MKLSALHKIILNAVTLVVAVIVVVILALVITKGGKMMQEQTGVSYKTYLLLVVIAEIFWIVGAVMILSAMGINVMQNLAQLKLWKFYQVISKFDATTIRLVGIVGWIGFVMNRSISFLSPGYLLIFGGRKLPSYLFYLAWTEVGLEIFMTMLIFVTLKFGKSSK